MSRFCVFILRKVNSLENLQKKLYSFATNKECGVYFNPKNAMLLTNNFEIQADDVVFLVTDKANTNDASLLLSYDEMITNGKKPALPLKRRLELIQEIAEICTLYSNTVDIYLSDDNPFLPDYIKYTISTSHIAESIFEEYEKEKISPFIPCVHISVQWDKGTVLLSPDEDENRA